MHGTRNSVAVVSTKDLFYRVLFSSRNLGLAIHHISFCLVHCYPVG